MNNCECDNCEHCFGYRNSTRRGFSCNHPNQRYIIDYFHKHKIQKMPGFIGFGEKFATVPKNKTTPKWCPKKSEGESEVSGNEYDGE